MANKKIALMKLSFRQCFRFPFLIFTLIKMKKMHKTATTHAQIKQILGIAISKKLSVKEFAGKIWLETVYGSFPESVLVSMMFEKALQISPAEAVDLIQQLTKLTLCGDSTAIIRALTIISDGLIASSSLKQ